MNRLCVRCCKDENTFLIPCDCIYNVQEQAFSTACKFLLNWEFAKSLGLGAITNDMNNFGYECIPAAKVVHETNTKGNEYQFFSLKNKFGFMII